MLTPTKFYEPPRACARRFLCLWTVAALDLAPDPADRVLADRAAKQGRKRAAHPTCVGAGQVAIRASATSSIKVMICIQLRRRSLMTFAREPGGDLEVVALSKRSNPSKMAAGREGAACAFPVPRLW